ncbi:hypothetical protein POL68_13845 [Stigmatella sp. ncwal1]|uniref:Glucosyltransferase-I n=1 Tax=Stigmatella ashevillensis TaxID=2995309 RepID=A0ABT5D9S4_9BACT|nr:hypothetical protein [Stigmatella ashevillena]MDC0709548.1 hypothetical protein [Stigmatella ashevillena]
MLAACGPPQDVQAPDVGAPAEEIEGSLPPPRPETCTPVSCEDRGAQCGSLSDGCGGTLQCGTCSGGTTCGGGGGEHVCGTPDYGVDTACSRDGVCFLNPRPVSHDFKDVWGRSIEDFWAVGNAGFIVHGGPSGLTVLPSDAELSGIWGSAGEDVWAVGSEILHFDGRRWSTALRPERFLLDVYGTGAGNVWAVGEGGVAYAWEGTRWERQSTGTSADLYGVWAHGEEVWVVGTGATLRVRDAKGWREIEAPARDVTFTSVWGTGPKDVWVTGARSGAVLFHWDGHAWSSVQLPFSALYGLSGSSSTDILAVGEEGVAQYDGSRWTTLPGNASSRLLGAWHAVDGRLAVGISGRVLRSAEGSAWLSLDQGVRSNFVSLSAPEEGRWWFADGSSVRSGLPPAESAQVGAGNSLTEDVPGRVWVVGNAGRLDLHTWSSTSSGTNHFYLPRNFNFHGVYPLRDMWVWAAGADTLTGEGVIIQLDGYTSWTHYPLATGALRAIHGTSPDDVWALGDSVIAHWDGTAWTETHGAWLPSFRAVHALGRDLAWALGPNSLWRWDGMKWAPMALPSGLEKLELHALFADSRDELFIAGDGGLLLRYDVAHEAWRRIDTGTRKRLRALDGGPRTLVLAGEDGTVLRLYR